MQKEHQSRDLHIFSCCVGCSVCCLGYWRLSYVIWRLRFEVTLHKSRSLRDSVFVEIKHFKIFRILVRLCEIT